MLHAWVADSIHIPQAASLGSTTKASYRACIQPTTRRPGRLSCVFFLVEVLRG